MTRQELAWQKAGARRALQYTMAPLALCLGIDFRATVERAVDALFETDQRWVRTDPWEEAAREWAWNIEYGNEYWGVAPGVWLTRYSALFIGTQRGGQHARKHLGTQRGES